MEYKTMYEWIKKHLPLLITGLVTVSVLIFIYACEPKTQSLKREGVFVNRQELQLELKQLAGLAQIRMADLDKQEQLRAVILQNALILVQGQPFNPVGMITGIAALYGLGQAGCNVTKVAKNIAHKRKVKNGTG